MKPDCHIRTDLVIRAVVLIVLKPGMSPLPASSGSVILVRTSGGTAILSRIQPGHGRTAAAGGSAGGGMANPPFLTDVAFGSAAERQDVQQINEPAWGARASPRDRTAFRSHQG